MNAALALKTIRENGLRPFIGEDGYLYLTGPRREVVDRFAVEFSSFEHDIMAILREHEVVCATDVVRCAENFITPRPRGRAKVLNSHKVRAS
jgi:hypothetical protein